MGASNWAICPRCVKRAEDARTAQIAATGASYGTVPEQDYIEAVKAIRDVRPEDYRTFREDYEIYGVRDGAVIVDYAGGCETCGLSLRFSETKPVPGLDAEAAP